ncbi:helix-turn-helix domain-containing protein [Streptomyces sp. NPDC004539]|uniref:helix-turn-helix domain-containing protein n=1 Tax=Streptomyces sp. NPDC004539 TaxID=3154280 RepID=UPI0033B3F81E
MTARDKDGTRWAEELLALLRPSAGHGVDGTVAWLARTLDADVSLHDGTGTPVAGHPLPLDATPADSVLDGRIAAASWEGDGRYLRLVRVVRPAPARPWLLAAARTTPFGPGASDVVAHTAAVLEAVLRTREADATERRLRRAAADLRLAILQLLMVEDTVAARRVAAGLWPGLLDVETARVYIAESTVEDRDRLAEDCLAATRDAALVVRCPAMDPQVIIVVPDETADARLRALPARRPGTYLGGSVPHALARTATAYGQAASALAVARFHPDRTAVYTERTHPRRLMDPQDLNAWALDLLSPLDRLPHHVRAELVATTRLGLEFTAVRAARILGVSRNTVRARMERVESLIGTDLSDLASRAALHLALAHRDSPVEPAPPATLGDLLTAPALRTWAHTLLARLDADPRDLRGTLRAWIAAQGNAERAADALGIHPQTVREHVRSAEPVLERQLLAPGGDLYEVVLAHLVTGDVVHPAPGQANGGEPGGPVHR